MEIGTVGIVGAGTMGGGIAINLAQHGFDRAAHRQPAGSGGGRGRAAGARPSTPARSRRGGWRAQDAEAAAAGSTRATALDELAAADLVIEAVFEDFDLKAGLLGGAEPRVARRTRWSPPTRAACGSATLRGHVAGPGPLPGPALFQPRRGQPDRRGGEGRWPRMMRRSRRHSPSAGRSGKQPLRCKDAYGFAINRFFCPYTNEAVRALDDGPGLDRRDRRGGREVLGAAAGPFAVMNLIKPRINLHAIRNLGAARALLRAGRVHGRGRRGRPDAG